jgi:uncharacterized protein (TIGR03435 family)
MVRLLCLATSVGVSMVAALACGQSPGSRVDPVLLRFELAAIHADSPSGMGGSASVQWRDGGYEASHVTVKEMVREAYGVEDVQIQNDPKWMDSQAFTVEAKVDGTTADLMKGLDDDGLRVGREHMLQALLSERFGLVVTASVKQLPVYDITYANGVPGMRGAKASQYEDGEKWGDGSLMGPHVVSYLFIDGHIEMKGQGASVDQLIDRLNQKLSSQLGRIFVNETKLVGNFDFDLSFTVPWRTVRGPMEGALSAGVLDGESTDFSLFPALKEQLGLRIKSTRGPVRTLWIERVGQPTEN